MGKVKLNAVQRETHMLLAAIQGNTIDYFDPPPTEEELKVFEILQREIAEATEKSYTIDIPYDYD